MKHFRLYIAIMIIPLIGSCKIYGQSLFEVFGGVNNSKFYEKAETPDFTATYDSKNTCIFGFRLKDRKNNLINLSYGFDYLYRNVHIESESGGLGGKIDRDIFYKIHSLNFRILPEICLGKKVGLHFNIGPYLGVIINSQKSGTGSNKFITGDSYTWTESGSAKDDFHGVDLGLSTTLGIEINIVKEITFFADANYSIGLNNISSGSMGSYGKINSKNLFLTTGLSYRFKKFTLIDILKQR